jgi:phosphatidylserine decarboxylase
MITSGSQSCNRAQQARRAPALSTLLYWKQHLAYRCSQKSIEENVDPRLSTDLPVLLNQEDFLASPHSIVLEFARWISSSPTHEKDFNEAIRTATSHSTADLRDQNITYLLSFLDFLTMYLEWTPTEIVDGRNVYRQCLISYFVLNQPSVIDYQNKRYPGSSSEPSTWLSQWMISFGLAFGAYKDTPASMNEKSMATFRDATKFKVGDYMEPEAGRKTFNEFFSRRANPERRPIAAPEDSSVWTSPED